MILKEAPNIPPVERPGTKPSGPEEPGKDYPATAAESLARLRTTWPEAAERMVDEEGPMRAMNWWTTALTATSPALVLGMVLK